MMKTLTSNYQAIPDPMIRRGVLVMVFSVFAFTLNALLLRYFSGAEKGISPGVPMLFRAATGMVIVLIFFRGRRPTRIVPVFREPLLILRGVTGLLGTAAFYWTIPELGAGMATLICNTYVIFASVIAVMALGEQLTFSRFVCLASAFVGIILLVGRGEPSSGLSFGLYEAVALGGAILAASSVVLVRRLVEDHSNGTIYLSQCVWIFLPALAFAGPHLVDLSFADVFLMVVAGVCAGYGQLAMNEGYRCLSVATGASIQMLWPVMTTLGGWLLFEERLLPVQLCGAGLILISIWLISTRKN